MTEDHDDALFNRTLTALNNGGVLHPAATGEGYDLGPGLRLSSRSVRRLARTSVIEPAGDGSFRLADMERGTRRDRRNTALLMSFSIFVLAAATIGPLLWQ